MALRASTRDGQIIRYVFDADSSGGFSLAINRTLAIADATAVFSTSAVGANLFVRKGAAVCVTIPTNNTTDEVRQASLLNLTNAYFTAGNTMEFVTSAGALRGIAYVTVLPGIVSSS